MKQAQYDSRIELLKAAGPDAKCFAGSVAAAGMLCQDILSKADEVTVDLPQHLLKPGMRSDALKASGIIWGDHSLA